MASIDRNVKIFPKTHVIGTLKKVTLRASMRRSMVI